LDLSCAEPYERSRPILTKDEDCIAFETVLAEAVGYNKVAGTVL